MSIDDEIPIAEGTLSQTLDPRAHNHLIGQNEALARLVSAFESGRFPHAWLLTGQMGIGKATLAWHFARKIVEAGKADFTPSPELLTRYRAHNHPNIYSLTRPADDKKGFKSQIPIDSVRGLIEKLHLARTENGWRAVIIDPMEALNTAASNAMLKLLEEPPAQVAFFLISHAPSQLLPTIRSRSQILRLADLSPQSMMEIWPLVSDEPLPELSAFELAEGSIRNAFETDVVFMESYQRALKMLASAPRMHHDEMLAFADAINTGNRSETLTNANKLFGLISGRIIRENIEQSTQLQLPQIVVSKAGQWAEFAFETSQKLHEAARLNLDAETAIFHRWLAIEKMLKS